MIYSCSTQDPAIEDKVLVRSVQSVVLLSRSRVWRLRPLSTEDAAKMAGPYNPCRLRMCLTVSAAIAIIRPIADCGHIGVTPTLTTSVRQRYSVDVVRVV
jgi:hypothetical protein